MVQTPLTWVFKFLTTDSRRIYIYIYIYIYILHMPNPRYRLLLLLALYSDQH